MSTLRSVQVQFRAASLKGPAPALAAVVLGAGVDPARRLQIHRNHLRTTLTDALAATFPTVTRLVGDAFFGAVARDFIAVEPPASPCLFEYGAGFADFVSVHRACRPLPYLADVARFDWIVNVAYHAPDRPTLDPARLAGLTPAQYGRVRLDPHPATQLLASPYPVLDIWHMAHAADNAAPVDLGAGGAHLLVHRSGLDVRFRALNHAEHALLGAVIAGRSLAEAWECALDIDLAPGAAHRALATALTLDLFTDLTVTAPADSRRPVPPVDRKDPS